MRPIVVALLTVTATLVGCEVRDATLGPSKSEPVHGKVVGHVQHPDGSDAAGVVVRLERDGGCGYSILCSGGGATGARREVTTDAMGRFAFIEVILGSHRVVIPATNDHHEIESQRLSIQHERDYRVDFVLRPVLQKLRLTARIDAVEGREFVRARALLSNDSPESPTFVARCASLDWFEVIGPDRSPSRTGLSQPERPCLSLGHGLLPPQSSFLEVVDFGWEWEGGAPSRALPAGEYLLVAEVTLYDENLHRFVLRDELAIEWAPTGGS